MFVTFNFKISNTFKEWSDFYDNDIAEKKDIIASLGIKPVFRAFNVDSPEDVIICWETPNKAIIEQFMAENEANIAKSGHIIESTVLSFFDDA